MSSTPRDHAYPEPPAFFGQPAGRPAQSMSAGRKPRSAPIRAGASRDDVPWAAEDAPVSTAPGEDDIRADEAADVLQDAPPEPNDQDVRTEPGPADSGGGGDAGPEPK